MEKSNDIFSQLSWFRASRVSTAKVMVVGCGALGNEVIKSLAMFGVGTLVVVDFDKVELGNLSRSVLFSREDARGGVPKVDAVRRGVSRINPDVRVIGLDADIATGVGLSLIASMDVIVGCVDSRWSRYCINRLAFRAGVPWVDGGIDGLEGSVRVFEYGYNCYACSLGENGLRQMAQRLSCGNIVRHNRDNNRVATTPIVASVVGAVEAQEAMKIIHRGYVPEHTFSSLRGKMFYYEGEHLTTKLLDFEAYDDDCPLHESWEEIVSSALSSEMTLSEVLEQLRELMQCESVSIELVNHSFVEYVESRDGVRKQVCLPSFLVEDFVARDSELSGVLSSELYQKELRELDDRSPYQHLTLRQLGVPHWDVLQAKGEGCMCYFSLDADRDYYNL